MLDIVTNSLGLLILVATLTATSSEGIKVTLGTPVMQFVQDDQTIVEFELSGGEMRPVDVEFIMPDIYDFFNEDISYDDQRRIGNAFNNRNVSDDYYSYRFDLQEGGIRLIPKRDFPGDTFDDLQDPNSEVRVRLAKYRPEETVISFYVRGDSFEQYRQIREFLIEQGFQVGWSPYPGEDPLMLYLSYGRKIVG